MFKARLSIVNRHADQLRNHPGSEQEVNITTDEPVEGNFDYPEPVQPVDQRPAEDQASLPSRHYPQQDTS